MLWTPKAPTPAPRPLVTPLPRKLPISLHPSCVLALLPQNDPKWFDHSGHGNHSIVHGATPTAKGPSGFAWEFDRVDDYIRTPNSASLNPAHMTIVMQIGFITMPHANQVILNKELQYRLVISELVPRRFSIRYQTTTTPWVNGTLLGTTDLEDNRWYQTTMSYNEVFWRLYLGRELEGERPESGHIGLTYNDLFLSNRAVGAPEFFGGLIDYVLIYNQAWSPRPQDPNYLPEIDPFLGGF